MFLKGTGAAGRQLKLGPPQIIALGFVSVIFAGALLLTLPISSRASNWTSFIDALFTATSATCVTGLVVVDTYQYFSGFGQAVILLLIQIGGLGFMTMATMLSMFVRRHISMKERVLQAQSVGAIDIKGIVRITKHILIGTFAIEGVGAIILSIRFYSDFGFPGCVIKGVFHSISAFCNAGFDLMGERGAFTSLTGYVDDIPVNVVVMSLVVIGGLGFIVWEEILAKRSFKALSLYSKMVIVITSLLVAGGAVLFFLFENSNPETMENLSPLGKALASFFQSVTPRTAGFNTISQADMTGQSKALTAVLMFIGGSSGSTAGGIKTATFGVLLMAVVSVLKGKKDITINRRSISYDNAHRAFAIAAVGLGLIMTSAFIMSFHDGLYSFQQALFESVSAFGTVGLSLGITPALSTLSKLLLIFLMYFGRVGIITVAYAIVVRMKSSAGSSIKYPEGKVIIG